VEELCRLPVVRRGIRKHVSSVEKLTRWYSELTKSSKITFDRIECKFCGLLKIDAIFK
jgi:hypothetical protein